MYVINIEKFNAFIQGIAKNDHDNGMTSFGEIISSEKISSIQKIEIACKILTNTKCKINDNNIKKYNASIQNIAEKDYFDRNPDGTTLLGEIILSEKISSIQKIEIATKIVTNTKYKINTYLNNKNGMDCVLNNPKLCGGKTILHCVLYIASKLTGSVEEISVVTNFFKKLIKRNNNCEIKDQFNPNYPTMSHCSFTGESDYHM